MRLRVMQKREDVLGSLVQDVRKAVEKVSNGNDDVSLNPEVNVRSQKLEEKLYVCNADLR
jgi:hypothetical protein